MALGRLCSCFAVLSKDVNKGQAGDPSTGVVKTPSPVSSSLPMLFVPPPTDDANTCEAAASALSMLPVLADRKTVTSVVESRSSAGPSIPIARLSPAPHSSAPAENACLVIPDDMNTQPACMLPPRLSVELENMPSSGKATAASYPTAASMPASLDDSISGIRTVKSKRLSRRRRTKGSDDPEADVAVRALSQLMGGELRHDLNTSASCSISPESDRPSPQRPSPPRLFGSSHLHLPPTRGLLRPTFTLAVSLPQSPSGSVAGRPSPRTAAAAAALESAAANPRDGGGSGSETGSPAAHKMRTSAAVPQTVVPHRLSNRGMQHDTTVAASPLQRPTSPPPVALEDVTLGVAAPAAWRAPAVPPGGGGGGGGAGRDGSVSNLVRALYITRNVSLRAALARQGPATSATSAASGTDAAGSAAGAPQPPVTSAAAATATAAAAGYNGGASVFSTDMALTAAASSAAGGRGRYTGGGGGGGGSAAQVLPAVSALGTEAAAAAGVLPLPRNVVRASAPQIMSREDRGDAAGENHPEGAAAAAAAADGVAAGPSYVAGAGERDGGIAGMLQLPSYGSAPLVPMYGGSMRLPYQASRHMSQIAFLQMLQLGAAASEAGQDPLGPFSSPHYQQHLATLNLTSLSREITGLRWIGQGGGGAVFQGVWQGAPVAVKFLLSEVNMESPGAVEALALEGVVSSVVNHPNVVHTFAFQCSRLTEASFAPDGEYGSRHDSTLDDQGNPDLFESLLDTNAMYGSGLLFSGNNMMSNLGSGAARRMGGGGGGPGGGGPSRLGTAAVQLPQVESNRSTPVRQRGNEDAAGLGAEEEGGEEEPDVRRRLRDVRDGGGSVGGGRRTPPSVQRMQEDESDLHRRGSAVRVYDKARGQAPPGAAAAAQRQLALESTFHSEEGFGDPDLAGGGRCWTVLQALTHLKARPGMYMTYIIMEYCDRGSLLSAIRRGIFKMEDEPASHTPRTPTEFERAANSGGASSSRFPRRIVLRALLRTARDIAQGMSHLHANGIIHGDLKPGNVLLRGCRTDRRGFVAMVADFGLSKVSMSDKPLEAHHWSTVTVMAPEVIMGRWLKASDVFSFGILLWQLVTSEPVPYGKLTVPQILMGVSQGTLKPEWPASAHPALVRLGRACLATSPEKRPSFEAIVKVLTKIEKHVREELRHKRAIEAAGAATVATPSPSSRGSSAAYHDPSAEPLPVGGGAGGRGGGGGAPGPARGAIAAAAGAGGVLGRFYAPERASA